MQVLTTLTGQLFRCRRGATVVEYGLIIALVVLAMVGALSSVADTTTGMWNNVSVAVLNAR